MCSDWSTIVLYLAIITLRKVIIILKHYFSEFLDVSEEINMNKIKENTVALIIT